MRRCERWMTGLTALWCVDRFARSAAIEHFFGRPALPAPADWPSVTVLQPITRGVHDLAHQLTTRLALDYPAPIQHLLICDVADRENQQICRRVIASHPAINVRLLLVKATQGDVATKIEKLQTALSHATGAVLLFVDDDVALRPHSLRLLLPYLEQPQVGAVFGLACYTNWHNVWSSAMSAFVNTNALVSYIPLTCLTEPFTITGHCFALRRTIFEQVGGLNDMAKRVGDDHELAHRLAHHGLRSLQTPLIYDVDNDLPTLTAYAAQMQRWFVFPRLMLLPQLARRDRWVMLAGSLGQAVPPAATVLLLATRRWRMLGHWLLLMILLLAGYIHDERRYLGRTTPRRRLWLVPLVAIVAPLQIGWSLRGRTVRWRGQQLRIRRDGTIEVL